MYLEQGHGECAKTAAAVLHAERARRLDQFSERLRRYYPESVYGGEDGAMPPEILAAVKEAGSAQRKKVDDITVMVVDIDSLKDSRSEAARAAGELELSKRGDSRRADISVVDVEYEPDADNSCEATCEA